KDLVNWKLIGYGLHREDQATGAVNLVDVQQNGGIHAPTIRHNNGIFYIIVTNVYSPPAGGSGQMVNFVITAKNPTGPWSKPHVIEGAPGIDPDLFFDEDGKVYFVGTHAVGKPNENGIGEIWVQELDLNEWKLVGERFSVWRGACGGCCVEGPHMYKQYGKYYLMVAEGGTSHNHAVMIAASDKISGPFESNPRNPILTSRHLSNSNWVHSTGHADLVELNDGRWFMVLLFLLRIFHEFLKENQVSFENEMVLNMGQFLSIPFVVLGLLILFSNYINTFINEKSGEKK
uniref:prolipoprotein diacylglyceryl transferase family protein n=1 Tax=Flavobacterium sp. TaxID=239 RepID=UPI0040495000